MWKKTFKIQIYGQIQGVGFRPFVFNLATKHLLSGTVSNNENGVIIHINTSKENASFFLEQIIENKPKISIITASLLEEVPYSEYKNFAIVPADAKEQINIPLTPDFSVCETCIKEINDINNKRYNYAFTTCVHCGPRYTITTKFPFERVNTTLSSFAMCDSCNQEYINPANKRFHSQTNSCSECGITLKLVNQSGDTIEVNQQEIIKKTAQLIDEGKIIAIKNTNGYLLCCDASNPKAIHKLRKNKRRPNKPFAVLYPSIDVIKNDFEITATEKDALLSGIAPIVILQNNKNSRISVATIAPKLNQTGVMLPSSSLMALVMQALGNPIIATSGNIHGSPIISTEKEAHQKLMNVADYFLHHNLDIQFPQDDSVLKFVNDKQVILRRSRGLAPNYIGNTTKKSDPILAMGSHLKSTFTFTPNAYTYKSQYLGNLDNYDVLERYKTTIKQYTTLFDTKPSTILIDQHPQYQSSIIGEELAIKWDARLIKIQHHKAHFSSVLGEHDLFGAKEKILGVVWDGTGLGQDNHIWGGEFFLYENNQIKREAHFEYFDWIANEKMAKEPRLSLFSLLDDAHRNLIKNKLSKTEWKVYSEIIRNNTLKTSSVGRLFDAVAAALDIVDINSYEAEAAMLLENCANNYKGEEWINFSQHRTHQEIPSSLIVQKILTAYRHGASKEFIAYSFIYTLANIIIEIGKENNTRIIACSGGVFQNSILLSILRNLAKKEKINIKINRKLSPNDENISFGQLMYHQHIKN